MGEQKARWSFTTLKKGMGDKWPLESLDTGQASSSLLQGWVFSNVTDTITPVTSWPQTFLEGGRGRISDFVLG